MGGVGEARRKREALAEQAARPKNTCVVCGAPTNVKSHLIPRAIALDIRGDDKHLLIGSNSQFGQTQSQSGSWERFLCEHHEGCIHDYEQYAIKFIREFALDPHERLLFLRKGVANEPLIQFACSILWRYHTSNLPEARGVFIPEWEAALRTATFDGDLSAAPDILIAGHRQAIFRSNSYAYPPHRAVFMHRDVMQFVINGLIFMAKLDRRPFDPDTQKVLLNKERDFLFGYIKDGDFAEASRLYDIGRRMKVTRPLR